MFCLKTPQVIGFFRGEALEHESATSVFCLARGVCIKRIAAAFDRERQFKRVTDNRGLQTLLFVQSGRLFLFPHARLTKAEYGVTAVSFLEFVLFGGPLDEVLDASRRKFNGGSTRVTNEMEVVGLLDDGLVSSEAVHLRLADKSGLQQDLD